MDHELAKFLMLKCLVSPAELYQHTRRSKQIKNQWHRDDPCLTAINILLLFLCAFLVALSELSLGRHYDLG